MRTFILIDISFEVMLSQTLDPHSSSFHKTIIYYFELTDNFLYIKALSVNIFVCINKCMRPYISVSFLCCYVGWNNMWIYPEVTLHVVWWHHNLLTCQCFTYFHTPGHWTVIGRLLNVGTNECLLWPFHLY